MVIERLYYAEADEEVARAWWIDRDLVLGFMRRIYGREFDPANRIDAVMLDAVREVFDRAVDEGFGTRAFAESEYSFYEQLRYNNAVFAAFKVHRMQHDMAARLLDAEGGLKSFRQWRREVEPIASHQVGSWLRTEYDTAVKRAHIAADWKRFEAEADVFPNLEWMPSTSVEPRLSHMRFYGLVLPVGHPFWQRHMPGDLWGCKCGLQATRAPRTPEDRIPQEMPGSEPQPGIETNPAHTAAIFSPSHPYVAKARKGAVDAVQTALDELYPDWIGGRELPKTMEQLKTRRKEITEWAKKNSRNRPFRNPGFDKDIYISKASIKEFLNQPCDHVEYKNELLVQIGDVLKEAEYIGWNKHKNKTVDNLEKSHMFEIRMQGDKAWIIVREYKDGEIRLHSISTKETVTEGIKK